MTEAGGRLPDKGILVFDSIHHVLAAERAFLDRGLWCDMIPTPRTISSNCGMVLEFRAADSSDVADLVATLVTGPRRLYRRCAGQYEKVDRLA